MIWQPVGIEIERGMESQRRVAHWFRGRHRAGDRFQDAVHDT